MSICKECLSSIRIEQEHCTYCGVPKNTGTIDQILARRKTHLNKVAIMAVLGLLLIGVLVFTADAVLPSFCDEGCRMTPTAHAVSLQSDEDYLAAAFNPQR